MVIVIIPFAIGTQVDPPLESGRRKGAAIAMGIAGCFGLFCLLFGLTAFLLVSKLGYRYYVIPAESMEPTLMGHDLYNPKTGQRRSDAIHDQVQCNTQVYRSRQPRFGEIAVFTAPKEADSADVARGLPQQELILVKRIIGLPGDAIEIKNGAVYRNGKRLDEYHNPLGAAAYTIKEPMLESLEPQYHFGTAQSTGPIHLGPDQYWVMGDNRNDSNDSRYWGPLTRDRIIGKVTAIVEPASRARSFP